MTPAKLRDLGVKSYVLYESCIRIGPRPPISMETMYADVSALGRIFGIEAQADAMVEGFPPPGRGRHGQDRACRATSADHVLRRLQWRRPAAHDRHGGDAPVVVRLGRRPERVRRREGQLRHRRLGNDDQSRPGVDRDLQSARVPHEDTINYLTTSPALANMTAVKKRQFIFMTYAERSPSTRNVDALERLAKRDPPRAVRELANMGATTIEAAPRRRRRAGGWCCWRGWGSRRWSPR